ncbi:hypothetical protein EDD16DRAFT_1519558 [Pisolithus croceorrhizus]|nr:hypothetical protein EV401DRAFT_1893543 [Pisolithus croceorrhizus]KAI6119168.1 hypothetical protein EDD16DRAFT_1519558 [Pisolithus croceorrhizus]KAI6160572.1 hypothetical protein EDD17DRAFT_1510237 [Pisolithus thermaeus]
MARGHCTKQPTQESPEPPPPTPGHPVIVPEPEPATKAYPSHNHHAPACYQLPPLVDSNMQESEYFNINDITDDGDDGDDEEPPVPRAHPKSCSTLDVLHFFKKHKGEPMVCKPSNGTTPDAMLHGQIEKYHLEEFLAETEHHVPNDEPPVFSGPCPPPLGAGLPPFSISALHHYLVRFIMADNQSLNIIEFPEFCELILLLHQDLRNSDIPHHTKLYALREYFTILKRDMVISNAEGKVSVTFDYWTDENSCLFLVVIAHWIGKGSGLGMLQLKAGLVAFHYIPGSHTGAFICIMDKSYLHPAGTFHYG